MAATRSRQTFGRLSVLNSPHLPSDSWPRNRKECGLVIVLCRSTWHLSLMAPFFGVGALQFIECSRKVVSARVTESNHSLMSPSE
jgi:hypothetical protein